MARIQVNILTTYASPNSLALIYPLLANRSFFRDRGIKFSFYDSLSAKISDCDTIFINSKFFRAWHIEREKDLYDTLAGFKKRTRKVIWFDTTDSSGTTQFNVMPFVSGYYKSQVLKNRSLYERHFYGNRIFADYYKGLFGLTENSDSHDEAENGPAISAILKKEDMHKLGVSWNSAMHDWGTHIYNYTYTGMVARLISCLPVNTDYKIRFVRPDNYRKIRISGRMGLSHAINAIRLQREKVAKILKEEFGVVASRIPRKRYIDELKNAWIGVSPFGLGEISCRDFEVIINGAVMFKQDMSHLETWPPLYADEKTYVSFKWDLSDFETKLRALLEDKDRARRISEEAQRTYEYYLYGAGRLEFCNKVMDILK